MPDALHKQLLVTWLGLDLHQALGCPTRAPAKSVKDHIVEEFLSLLPSLTPEKKRAFLDLLKVSVEPPQSPPRPIPARRSDPARVAVFSAPRDNSQAKNYNNDT